MNCQNIQKLIDDTNYWDARVEKVECNNFSDEVTVAFKEERCKVIYKFVECYRVLFDHIKTYEKNCPVKDLSYAQIPYFLTDINIKEVNEQKQNFIKCKITMFPLNIEILCKDVIVQQKYIT